MLQQLYGILDEIRRTYAPDARSAVFEVEVAREESGLVIFGASSVPSAVEALRARIAELDPTQAIRDELVRLPIDDGVPPPHALITAATAPMLAGPIISESHLSQVLLGHRVMVLREHGRWLQCRSADGYLGWIHRGYVRRLSEGDARRWEMGADLPLHVSLGAKVLDSAGTPQLKLPWGAKVMVDGEEAVLPDGRRGKLRGRLVPLIDLASHFPPDGAAVVATATAWQGTPYLWGGTTPWGADCSGLVQAVYRMHGFELPRDSDQQAMIGEEVSTEDDFGGVEAGDLLFFAEQRDRISHVAISLGGSRIVHSAVGNGGVSTNDLLGRNGYERQLRPLLVTARRVLSEEP